MLFLSAALVTTLGLFAAVLTHTRNPDVFQAAIRNQGLVGGDLASKIASMIVTLVEVILLALWVATFLFGEIRGNLLAPLASVTALVYGSFAIYAAYLLKTRPGVACGCSANNEPVGIWTVIRAAGFFGAAGYVAWLSDPGSSTQIPFIQTSMGVLAGLSIAHVLWLLPSALAAPVLDPRR